MSQKNTLTYKGYGRIYVETEADIQKVKDVIKELDPFEFDYLPADLIVPFSEYPKVTYVHKFNDFCMNRLQAVCWKRGIHVFVCDNFQYDKMEDATKPAGPDETIEFTSPQ